MIAAGAGLLASATGPAGADTLKWALTQAYQNNPQLNSQRASVRATDETVPQALSGYRPRVSLTATAGEQYLDTTTKTSGASGIATYSQASGNIGVQSYGGTITQPLLNGFGTSSRTRQAEQLVSSARETLRLSEQTILLNAATAYMNLIRDAAILDLQRRNVEVLQEQLRQTRDRFSVGEVTRTDVAQSESRLAAARAQMLTAESNYTTSRSTYRQMIGVEPGTLAPASPVDRLSPQSLPAGDHRSARPAPLGHDRDVQRRCGGVPGQDRGEFALSDAQPGRQRAAELWLVSRRWLSCNNFTGSVVGQLAVPVYQGGTEYATIRQAKETLTQRRTDLDTARDQAQQTLVQSWGQLEAAKAQIQATTTQVNAAEIALNGVREEARVGQRTTLDVLNAQQELVNARVSLVTAQRDRVVASYSLLAASGRLSPKVLDLVVPIYDPRVHYHQVRDTWVGVRTPDGK